MVFAALICAGTARAGTLYAADNLTDGSLNGVVTIDAATLAWTGAFLSDGYVAGLATDATSVYASLPAGVAKYTTVGTFAGMYDNRGTDSFGALAVSGGTLFAADTLTDSSLNGVVTIDAASLGRTGAFLTDGFVAGLATDGTSVFASLPGGICAYSLSGTLLATYDNRGTDSFGALAFADGTLFAADNLTDGSLNGVVTLDALLDRTGAFLTSGTVACLASDGASVYASLPDGISRYTTSGVFLDSYLNRGTDKFGALALSPPAAVPEPAAWTGFIIGFGVVGGALRRRSRLLSPA